LNSLSGDTVRLMTETQVASLQHELRSR